MFGRVLEVDAADPIALFGLGNALAALERWAEAEDAYARAIAAQRTNAALYLARGRVLERLSRGAEAVAVYRAGMEVASRRGDLAPLREMQTRVLLVGEPGQ
jgi:tetratricopeptide (TPR) repeat protein